MATKQLQKTPEIFCVNNIKITKLFGKFEHNFELFENGRISLLIGQNGIGKTTILKMIEAFCDDEVYRFKDYTFSTFEIEYTFNGQSIRSKIEKTSEDEIKRFDSRKENGKYLQEVEVAINSPATLESRIDSHFGSVLSSSDVIKANQIMNSLVKEKAQDLHKKVSNGASKLPALFIKTERLRAGNAETDASLAIIRYSKDLSDEIRKTLAKYSAISQTLDREFPVKLLQKSSQTYKVAVLGEQLKNIGELSQNLEEIGLGSSSSPEIVTFLQTISRIQTTDKLVSSALTLYITHTTEKLAVYRDICAKLKLLKDIIDNRFLHKNLTFNEDGFIVTDLDGKKVDLNLLSSGEQHQLILYYDLLFRAKPGSLIMIDEPELSLHLEWKLAFLKVIKQIAELNNFHILISTHSPSIINGEWDLAISLEG